MIAHRVKRTPLCVVLRLPHDCAPTDAWTGHRRRAWQWISRLVPVRYSTTRQRRDRMAPQRCGRRRLPAANLAAASFGVREPPQNRRRAYCWRSCRRVAAMTPGEAAAGDDVRVFQPANTSYHNIGRSGGDGAAATCLICARKLRQQKPLRTRVPPRILTTSIPRMIGD